MESSPYERFVAAKIRENDQELEELYIRIVCDNNMIFLVKTPFCNGKSNGNKTQTSNRAEYKVPT